MKILIKKNKYVLGDNIRIAESFITRLKGLMFIEKMNDFDGLLITRCNSIHNFFVRFPIDVIFLNTEMKVIKILKNFKPWRVSGIYLRASQVLELPAGKIPNDLEVNDYIEVENV